MRRCALHPPCQLVYHVDYEQSLPGVPLDPSRGEKILRFLDEQRLLRRETVIRGRPATLEELLRVHDADYLEGLDAQRLTRILGVPLDGRDAARVLSLQRLAVGGTLLATRVALRNRSIVANLGGGFHHAGRAQGQGFCLFNDVAIAVGAARARGLTGRVVVIDLDLHDGNGTRELFAHDPSVATYSIHNQDWGPPAEGHVSLALGHGVGDERYLSSIDGTLPEFLSRAEPVLAFFLAGVDVAAGDKLGNWQISEQALLARDRRVLELLRGPRLVPTVILLAGGYGQEAWRHSARTLAHLLGGRELHPPSSDALLFRHYRHMGHRLAAGDPAARKERPFELSAADLMAAGLQPVPGETDLFLEAWPLHTLELQLERFGLFQRLRQKGLEDLALSLVPSDLGPTLRIHAGGAAQQLVAELRARRSTSAVPGQSVLLIEWLLLQNPREPFGPGREPLPGQRHPGLGLLREVLGWLCLACERLGLGGVAFVPSHYHTAVRSRELLRCADPRAEARLRAMVEALAGCSLAQACQALDAGRLRDVRSQATVRWEPTALVLPVAEPLRQRLYGAEYEAEVAAARPEFEFALSAGASPS